MKWERTYSISQTPHFNPERSFRGIHPTTPPPPTASSPQDIELIEVLGQGGMGTVYRAHQTDLNRIVAVKTLKTDQQNLDSRAAFLSEAYVTAALDHPNVIPIYRLLDGDQENPKLAMKIVSGLSWKQLLHPKTAFESSKARELGDDFHIKTLRTLCNALAYAHDKKIAHCDLKPENIMIGEFGEVYIVDWGIAIEFSDAPCPQSQARHRTQVHAPFGTPSYMAPELADGDGRLIDHRTDIYLLGAILHELLLGTPPHAGNSYIELIVSAIQSRPSVFDQNIPEELCEICHRAMHRDPERRYQSVLEFQASLDEYLEHAASRKIAQGARERLQRGFVDAKRSRESGDLSARNDGYRDFAEAVSGFRQAQELWADNVVAQEGEEEARAAYIRLALDNEDLGLAEAQLANLEWQGADYCALESEVEAAKHERDQRHRWEAILRYSLILGAFLLITTLSIGLILVSSAQSAAKRSRDTALRKAKTARDALEVAAAARQESESNEKLAEKRYSLALKQLGDFALAQNKSFEAQAYYSRFLEVSPVRAGKLGLFFARGCAGASFLWTKTYQRRYRRTLFSVSKKSSVLAAFIPGKGIEITDLDQRTRTRMINTKDLEPVTNFCVSPNGQTLIVGSGRGLLAAWEIESGRLRWSKKMHKSAITSISISESPARVLSMERDWGFVLWDLETGSVIAKNRVEINGDNQGFLNPAGDKFVYRCPGFTGSFDFRTRQRMSRRNGDSLSGRVLAVNDDLTSIALAKTNEAPRIHDLNRSDLSADQFFVNKEIFANAASWSGSRLALADANGFIQIWDFGRKRFISKFRNNFESISTIQWANQGRTLVVAGPTGRIVAWAMDLESLRQELRLASRESLNHFVASEDGRYLGFAAKKTRYKPGCFYLWDSKEALLHEPVEINERHFLGLTFNKDQLLYLTRKGFRLYDPKRRQLSPMIEINGEFMPRKMGIVRDGCLIYPSLGQIVSFHLRTKQYKTLLFNTSKTFSGFRASRNKRWLVVQTQKVLTLIDLANFTTIRSWASKSGAFSPIVNNNGETILTSSPKGSHFLRRIDCQSSQFTEIGPLKQSLRFSEFSGSKHLVFTRLGDNSVGIFDWKEGRVVFRFQSRYITERARNMTLSADGDSMFLFCSGIIQKWSLKQWYGLEQRSTKDLARQVRRETQLILDGTALKSLLPASERELTKK